MSCLYRLVDKENNQYSSCFKFSIKNFSTHRIPLSVALALATCQMKLPSSFTLVLRTVSSSHAQYTDRIDLAYFLTNSTGHHLQTPRPVPTITRAFTCDLTGGRRRAILILIFSRYDLNFFVISQLTQRFHSKGNSKYGPRTSVSLYRIRAEERYYIEEGP